MATGGDPAGMDRMSSGLGAHASRLQAQSGAFGSAASALPTTRFAGGRADRTREFAARMQHASATAAKAYDVVASFLPRVSRASSEAAEAQTAAMRAKEKQATAAAANTRAELKLAAAEAALAAPRLLGGPAGPPPALVHARDAAARDVERTRRDLEAAQRAYRAAVRRADEAQRHRMSVLRAFTGLCRTAAVALNGALPEPPSAMPSLAPLLGLQIVTPQEMILRHEAATLLRVPEIADAAAFTGNPSRSKTLRLMLAHQQWAAIDELAPSPVAGRPAEARALPPKSFLRHVYELPVVHGVVDSAVGTAKAFYNLADAASKATDFTHPGVMVKQWKSIYHTAVVIGSHPGQTVSALVGWDQLQHDKWNWLGGAGLSALTSGGLSRIGRLSKEADVAKASAEAKYLDVRRGIADGTTSVADLRAARVARQATQQRAARLSNLDRIGDGYGRSTSMSGWTDFFALQAQAEQGQGDQQTGPPVGTAAERLAKHVAAGKRGRLPHP